MIERFSRMASLGITDLKAGLGVNIKGKDCVILEAQHVKPGKGNTYVRTKYRDIRTGRVNEENFQQSAKFESVNMQTREMQYLYNDGDIYYFMDNETYEQIEVGADLIGDNQKWMKENDVCQLQYANGVLYNVQPPMFVEVTITSTDPGFKGDTVQGGTKPAVIETGATIQVPMYLNEGETIKVDTRDGKFVQRV
jgi:elongation factor P